MNISVRTAEESIKTLADNTEIYEDGDWSIWRNKYFGLYICYKGCSLMFSKKSLPPEIPEVPPHILAKWTFLCQMEK